MLNGADFGKALLPLSGIARENFILSTFRAQGLVPIQWSKLRVEQVLAGKNRVLEMDVASLPAAIGTPDDPFFFPAWPWTYQAIANDIKAVLPTRKIVMAIAKVAAVQIEPRPFPTCNPTIPGVCQGVKGTSSDDGGKYNETSARWVQSNQGILKDLALSMSSGLYTPGRLVSGLKKDVVIGPNADGSRVLIFGWFHKGKFNDVPSDRWQGYSDIHEATYGPDYSHEWRPIKETAMLDGSPVLLTDVAQDKLLWPLVTDQGPFALHFPNAQKNVPPPPGYPPGTFYIQPPSKFAQGAATAAGVVGGVALGGAIGFAVGGPVGALAGAMLGAALGRA